MVFSQATGGMGQVQGGMPGLGAPGGIAGGALGGAGLTSPTTILAAPTIIKSSDPLPPLPSNANSILQNVELLKHNDFQKYVLEITGNKLPLFGASFFESIQTQKNQTTNTLVATGGMFETGGSSSVSGDYPIGPGDQLVIRGWGSLEIDVRAVVDKNGFINVPKIGSVYLAGVKFSQCEGLIKTAFSKYFKDFQLSVSMGQLRTINISVVGQARRPGTYALSSASTLATAFFSTGGINHIGSMRKVQLKRAGKSIADFDLYEFLAHGNNNGDIKLIDGDVLFIPQAYGYVALMGKVNNPAVYELKKSNENLEYLFSIAGGVSVNADPRKASIERLNPTLSPARTISEFSLDKNGLQIILQDADIITILTATSEIANAITLRGSLAQPKRVAWRQGIRISDLIPNKEFLMSKESTRRQNEVLFDANQRERTQRERENIPEDLLEDTLYDSRIDQRALKEARAKNSVIGDANLNNPASFGPASGAVSQTTRPADIKTNQTSNDNIRSIEAFREGRSARLFSNQNPLKINERNYVPSMVESIGNIYEEINWEYAVIERLDRRNLKTLLIPFNLGRVLNNKDEPENYALEPGDVVTVFSASDIRVPISKRNVIVRIEGEVARPGIYQVKPSETLTDVLQQAGGLTTEAYLFGAAFYRNEVRKSQVDNLEKLLRKLESELSGQLAQASQSLGAGSDASLNQARISSAQQAQKQALDRIRNLRPEGRVALGLEPQFLNFINRLPKIRMQNGDRLYVPPRPDFVYVYGAVNTESALIYKEGNTVKDYLELGGVSKGADRESVILIRADGSALTRGGEWFSSINNTKVMPGDSIVMPEKLDREASWSAVVRNSKDITQIFYQLGLGAAGLKALGY
jgi:polysaccharide export outer membrane protein